MHILIAEDDQVSRELLRRILESEPGHTRVFVPDGEEAWRRLQDPAESFDLCVFDILMPQLDGLDLAVRIRGHETLRRMPIILCTAANDRATVQRAAGLSVSGYIVKPYTRDRVVEKLRQVQAAIPDKPKPAPPPPPPPPPAPTLESTAAVCARLGIDADTHRTLLRAMLGDLRGWVEALKRPPAGAALDPLIVRANGLKGACLSLGATGAARHLVAVRSSLQASAPENPGPDAAALAELEKEVRLIAERCMADPVAA